ncbi:hypothetical protein N7470_003904 [Penicillium chermesinum]|nr:hypothetical protein N7470_003904 [Penicillium chermesinum]
MDRQNSRLRRTPRIQEPQAPQLPLAPRRRRSWRTGLFAVCLLLGIAYILDTPFGAWIAPLRSAHVLEATVKTRPHIGLRPENHVFRLAQTQHLDWRVTSEGRRPDGVLKQVYLINDLFPGPTIEARSGDTLIITVTNALREDSIALHWHGLHVANAMDGAAGVSQCPIPPGGKFIYNVTIPSDQSGTFWYHAHSGLLRADGLYGGLVVHTPVSRSTVRGMLSGNRGDAVRLHYDEEILLLVGDWYHRPAKQVLAWYENPGNFGNEPVPDSLLINGIGHFDCSMAVPARPLDCVEQQLDTSFLDLDPGRSYRIRVVNTGALAGFSMLFDAQLEPEIVQVDSVDVVEHSSATTGNSIGILHAGQRMDMILRSPDNPRNRSSMMVKLDRRTQHLHQTKSFPSTHRLEILKTPPIAIPMIQREIDLGNIPSVASILKKLPETADQRHVVYTKIQKKSMNHNIPQGFFNQTVWKSQQSPPVPLIGLPRSQWDRNQLSISTGPDPAWVDLIVNNLDEGPHPFHLHGHHFYVLTVQDPQFGWGSYNPFEDAFPPGLEPAEEWIRILTSRTI